MDSLGRITLDNGKLKPQNDSPYEVGPSLLDE